MSQKKIFAPPSPPFFPPQPPQISITQTFIILIWCHLLQRRDLGHKSLKKFAGKHRTPRGVKRGVRGVTHSFFDLFSKYWPFLKSASPCDSDGIISFVLYTFRFEKNNNFSFWFKIWDLAKKTEFSSFLSKKAENANFFYNRLIYI